MLDFSNVGAGFADPALGSQRVFRSALDAMSRPGKIQTLACHADLPVGVDPAACAFLLALLDQDTSLWLSPSIAATSAGAYLRLHTGCHLGSEPGRCDFAWVGSAGELPSLAHFNQGSDEYPDHSTTCVLQVDALEAGFGWTLTGPGIRETAKIAVIGPDSDFVDQWASNHAQFPCGVDLFLSCANKLLGLPRTTKIEV
jgi:alpha-D-ribose 1-methylphosphonate 5-triphosphate synthase subunit PhnH